MYPRYAGKKWKLTGLLTVLILISVYPFFVYYWWNLGEYESQISFVILKILTFPTDGSLIEGLVIGFLSAELAEMFVEPLKSLINNLIIFIIPYITVVIILHFFYYPTHRRLENPLYNIDNLIVEHKNSGTILWTYCFLRMAPDFFLPPGFISMVRVFVEEMQRADGDRYEKSDIGTLLRVEGEQIAVTGIMRYREIAVP